MPLFFQLTSDALQALPLTTAPVGWNEFSFLVARDTTYWGATVTVSSGLTFWKEGGAYIRTVYEGGEVGNGQTVPAAGIDGVCYLGVYEKDPNEYRNSLIHRGRVDLTQYKSTAKGVSVALKSLGLLDAVQARADSEVDLLGSTSLNGAYIAPPTPATVLMHSQMLRLKYAASQKDDAALSPGIMFGKSDDLSHEQLLYFGFDTQADNDLGIEPFGGGFTPAGATGSDSASPIYTAKENGRFTIEVALFAQVVAAATSGFQFRQFRQVEGKCHLRFVIGGVTTTYDLQPPTHDEDLDGDYVGAINVPARTFVVDLKVGDTIYLYSDYFVHDLTQLDGDPFAQYQATITATLYPGSYLTITAESTTPETTCRGLFIYEALQHLVAAMTDGGSFYSEYFGRTDTMPAYVMDGPGSRRFLTSGFNLRNFPLPTDPYTVGDDGIDPRKPFTGSFSKIYNSLDAIDCLGLGIEQRNGKPTLRIEPRSFFFQKRESLSLGAVQGLAKSPYLPGFHNQATVGYQRWQSGAAVGLDEFDGQRTYALPINAQKDTYTALSDVIAGGYPLEQTRRQQFVMGTNKEGQADQDLFLVCMNRSASGALVTEKNEAFSSVTGILSPETTYNLRISPGRMLRQHGAFIRAGLVPQAAAGKKILLTKVEGNDKLVSQLLTETVPVDEHASPVITDLPEPIYVAEQYEFTAKLRRQQVRQLMQNPYGQVSFLDGQGQRKSGYVLKVECTPDSGQASFTLLRTAS